MSKSPKNRAKTRAPSTRKTDVDSLSSKMTSDRFTACVFSNPTTAKHVLKFILPPEVSEQLDFDTLECKRTRIDTERGEEQIADFFFSVKVKPSIAPEGKIENFIIILEHKSTDEQGVVLQVALYDFALMWKMWQDKKRFLRDGKLSFPYPIVFSQDWSERDPPSLKEILATLPGLEKMLPDFKFQTFKICRAPIEAILQCEELTGLILYLERLAYKTTFEPEKEAKELAQLLQNCFKNLNPDERFQLGFQACMTYWAEIKKRRPQTPSTRKVYIEMNATGMVFDQSRIVKNCFPTLFRDVHNAANEKVKKARKEARAAKKEASAAKERAEQQTTSLKILLKDYIVDRFPNESHIQLETMIDSIEDFQTLRDILNRCYKFLSFDEMFQFVQSIIAVKENSGDDIA